MGSGRRRTPERLAEKLRHIREALGFSQNGMLVRLGLGEEMGRNSISNFERGFREPDLVVLLEYARAANVHVEVLIDDDLDLPDRLPCPITHVGIRRPSPAQRKSRR
ncbi:MAG TPA: helix-turn-helix transcriptional regulator [Blastocatellia bacterium]|nr:helix-turn-helix transcriptional regulator [Blastocatellia bacterium]